MSFEGIPVYKPKTYKSAPQLSGATGKRHPFIVVGSGPIGLAMALAMARKGHEVVIVTAFGWIIAGIGYYFRRYAIVRIISDVESLEDTTDQNEKYIDDLYRRQNVTRPGQRTPSRRTGSSSRTEPRRRRRVLNYGVS